jgi:Fe-S cluster assembly iron-binding protein IscA
MDIKIYDSAKKELDNLISAAADNKKYIRIFIRTLSF